MEKELHGWPRTLTEGWGEGGMQLLYAAEFMREAEGIGQY